MIGDFPGESSTRQATELTTAQRQELQMKKAKLVSMLDEVDILFSVRVSKFHHSN
jgi:hypothetical protein